MDDKFREVRYSEYEPDVDAQQVITDYVQGQPWLLVAVGHAGDGLSMQMEAGGGLTFDLIEPMLQKALIAFRQSQENLDT
jgi:hypothetical protein